MSLNKDLEFFNLIRQGDKEALSQLYVDYYDHLMHYGLRIHSDKVLIEECIQEMFIYIFEAGEKLGQVKNIKAYLFSAIRRSILKALKEQRKTTGETPEYIVKTNTLFSLEDILIKQEADSLNHKHSAILEALNNLSWRKREAIYLRYYNGLSTKEIAVVMSVSTQTVLNTIYQGLSKVREIISTSNFSNCILPLSFYIIS